MKVNLKYGERELELKLPREQITGIYSPKKIKSVGNLERAVRKSLSKPFGSKQLCHIAKPDQTAAIVIDDTTRDVPTRELLPPIVDELHKAGVKDRNISVIVAIGVHRKMKRSEMNAVMGKLKGRIKILSSDPVNNQKFLGVTSAGTKVFLNKDFLEADIKILTGDIEFHQFCGYGGGAKSVLPGLAETKTVALSHSKMEKSGTGPGSIKNNPVRQEIEEAGRMAKVDFIVNVVINAEKEVVGVFSGDVEKAFLQGTRLCDKIFKVVVPERADVVIASTGGYPRDIELYQSQKAIESARRVVKKGGKIILTAECREGFGSEHFKKWVSESKKLDDIFKRIGEEFIIGGHKAYQIARAVEWASVRLSSLKQNLSGVRHLRLPSL